MMGNVAILKRARHAVPLRFAVAVRLHGVGAIAVTWPA
jgi:hypothetical protein